MTKLSTSPWTDERIDQLRSLFNEGLSAAGIGRAMGISRSSAISKLRRLGLCLNLPTVKVRKIFGVAAPKRAYNRFEFRLSPWRKPLPEAPPKQDPTQPLPTSQPIAFLDRRMHETDDGPEQCPWPLWTPDTPLFDRMCCGSPVARGSHFCAGHHAMAFQPNTKRDFRALANFISTREAA